VSPSPFLDLALELVRASIESGGGPFGAVVVGGSGSWLAKEDRRRY